MTPFPPAIPDRSQARAIRLADGLRGFLPTVATPATGQIGRGGGISFNKESK